MVSSMCAMLLRSFIVLGGNGLYDPSSDQSNWRNESRRGAQHDHSTLCTIEMVFLVVPLTFRFVDVISDVTP